MQTCVGQTNRGQQQLISIIKISLSFMTVAGGSRSGVTLCSRETPRFFVSQMKIFNCKITNIYTVLNKKENQPTSFQSVEMYIIQN